MRFVRPIGATVALCAAIALTLTFVRFPARGFDLKGSPFLIQTPVADITDTYFFPSPTNPNNVVTVMDMYPSIPAGTTSIFFQNSVLYTMKFDTKYKEEAVGGRPNEDVVLQFAAGVPSGTGSNKTQQISVYGPSAPKRVGTSTVLVTAEPSARGLFNRTFSLDEGQVTVFAGLRRDPQFFDKTQFFSIFPASTQQNGGASCLSSTCPSGFAATGTNYFADSDVLSIVVEMPRSLLLNLGGGVGDGVAYWATSSTVNGG